MQAAAAAWFAEDVLAAAETPPTITRLSCLPAAAIDCWHQVPTPPGQGYYYGSDAKRSPMHKYRSPGSPEYTGEEEEEKEKEEGQSAGGDGAGKKAE